MKKMRFVFCLIGALLLLIFVFSACSFSDDLYNKTVISNGFANLYSETPLRESEPFLQEEQRETPPFNENEVGNSPFEEQQAEPPSLQKEGEESIPALTSYIYREPSTDTDPYTAACANANVRVRKGPSTSYDTLSVLSFGDSLPYLWREGEWLAVWAGERVGYINANYAFLSSTNRAIEKTIRAGLNKLGTPYEWGAARILNGKGEVSPYFTGNSFDCSSFVQYCYYVGCGIKLGNYTGSQADYTVGKIIRNYADLQRGDFYFTGNGTISHVVIYIGNGTLLQTYSANGGPVSLTSDESWKGKFLSGRRPNLSVIDQFC